MLRPEDTILNVIHVEHLTRGEVQLRCRYVLGEGGKERLCYQLFPVMASASRKASVAELLNAIAEHHVAHHEGKE